MANGTTRLNVTEFDFDRVKTNLKTFLKAQTEFKDYDFEGSGMNILLDTLAYNTHYLGFNANMLANEMFLDSAALRSSVVSHAKTLGYEPSSCRAPIATVNISLETDSPTKTMPAGTAFTSTVVGPIRPSIEYSSFETALRVRYVEYSVFLRLCPTDDRVCFHSLMSPPWLRNSAAQS